MKRLLVIDDSSLICAHIGSCLKGTDFEIKFAHSGPDALSTFFEFKPEIIVADVNIPPPSGLECVRKFREAGSTAKILMISSLSDNQIALEAIEAGAQDFLSKPFSRNEFTAALTAVMRK